MFTLMPTGHRDVLNLDEPERRRKAVSSLMITCGTRKVQSQNVSTRIQSTIAPSCRSIEKLPVFFWENACEGDKIVCFKGRGRSHTPFL